MGRAYGTCGGKNAYGALVENPEVMRQLGRPWCRWDDNIRMNLKGI
jgi:hypothetical protein